MPNHENNQSSSWKRCKQTHPSALPLKNKQAQIIINKSPIINRRPKANLEQNICFISPKKIAYFQTIDESCLNESQKTMLKKHGEKTEVNPLNLNFEQRENCIDYRSIKKCLSPRSTLVQNHAQKTIRKQVKQCCQVNDHQKLRNEEKETYERMILDLKMEIIEMSELLQEKEKIIQEKNIKIIELEKQICRDQNNQTIFESIKSISTTNEQRTSSIIDVSPFLHFDENHEKIFQMEEKIRSYEQQFKKFQIQIDVLRKFRFEKQRIESQMHAILKKNESYRRKIDRLISKNDKLRQEMSKRNDQSRQCEERSLILEFSPEKHIIQ